MEIRRVEIDEVAALQNIGRITFKETFEVSNSPEDMANYLNESFAYDKVEEELKNVNSAFYFAMDKDRIVGYLKLNFGHSQTEIKHEESLEIERIYVLNEYQGKKIGQQLYSFALQIAKEKAVDFIWLGVWEENTKAINFYKKNGFEVFDQHIFKLGEDEQIDLMMKYNLK